MKTFIIELSKNQDVYILHEEFKLPINIFPTDVYSSHLAIQVSIGVLRGIHFNDKVDVSLINKLPEQIEVCSKCGSSNIDIKAWVSKRTGQSSEVEDPDDSDTWCNDCQGHHGIKFKNPAPEGEIIFKRENP